MVHSLTQTHGANCSLHLMNQPDFVGPEHLLEGMFTIVACWRESNPIKTSFVYYLTWSVQLQGNYAASIATHCNG